MIHVYIATGEGTDDEESIDGFDLPSVPRVGETIYISYARMLYMHERERLRENIRSLENCRFINPNEGMLL